MVYIKITIDHKQSLFPLANLITLSIYLTVILIRNLCTYMFDIFNLINSIVY